MLKIKRNALKTQITAISCPLRIKASGAVRVQGLRKSQNSTVYLILIALLILLFSPAGSRERAFGNGSPGSEESDDRHS